MNSPSDEEQLVDELVQDLFLQMLARELKEQTNAISENVNESLAFAVCDPLKRMAAAQANGLSEQEEKNAERQDEVMGEIQRLPGSLRPLFTELADAQRETLAALNENAAQLAQSNVQVAALQRAANTNRWCLCACIALNIVLAIAVFTASHGWPQ
ncbi:hypothetical protein AAEY27_11310 [Kosakonia sp. BYX6]|uniref:Uncharacterized protein n=1 Tax=Kosakonia calanthes TaxID=3139408 RepID=A0ABZ3AZU9_9ENTR